MEDVFHAIHTGIIKIESIATDVAQGIIQISMSLANGVAEAVTYAVKTIDDVANAIQSAFQWLAAKVEEVINWLKELFSWQDIVNTGAVMAHIVSQFLSAASSYLAPSDSGPSPLQTLIDSKFAQLTNQINSSLESLAGNSNPMSQMVPSQYSSM
ncbi:MAG TPA: hypothetical protein VKJ45_24300 [Blastocatellia bacterium]|nr:hypothetical protein [Blastocatellia bacterium]